MRISIFIVFLTGAGLSPSSFADDRCAKIEGSESSFDSNKKFIGCRLVKVEKDSLYLDLGLKKGDLIDPQPKAEVDELDLDLE